MTNSNGTMTAGRNASHASPRPVLAELKAWFIFSQTVCLASSLLLILLIVTSLSSQQFRHGSQLLVIHLMVMHLMLCGLYYPLDFTDVYTATIGSHFPLNCASYLYAHLSTVQAESWASLFIAINRFVAVALPHRHKSMVTRKVLCGMMVLPWMIGFASTLPVYYGYGIDFGAGPPFGFCMIKSNGGVYGTVWVTIGSYLPTSLTAAVYSAVCIWLIVARIHAAYRVTSHNHPQAPARNAGLSSSVRARQISLAKTLVVSSLWQTICFVPGPLILTKYPYVYARSVMLQLWIPRTLPLCGYAASPAIFFALNKDYRAAVSRLMNRLVNGREDVLRPESILLSMSRRETRQQEGTHYL